jgi:hypothetical protein
MQPEAFLRFQMGHIEQIREHIEAMSPGQPGEIMDSTLYVERGLCRASVARGQIIARKQ